jgi:hypothetical protein
VKPAHIGAATLDWQLQPVDAVRRKTTRSYFSDPTLKPGAVNVRMETQGELP